MTTSREPSAANRLSEEMNAELLKAAKRILAIDAKASLPDENTSFDDYNEWVAALYALKQVVERLEREAD